MKRLLKFVLSVIVLFMLIQLVIFNMKVDAKPQISSVNQYKAKIVSGDKYYSLNFKAMVYDGKKYVAVSDKGVILQSEDGVKWSIVLNNANILPSSIAWDGKRYVVVGDKGNILYSTNGNAWLSAKSGTSEKINKVIWDGKLFKAVGQNGTYITSQDGQKWEDNNLGNYNVTDIASNGKQDILIAAHPDEQRILLSSMDQKHWIGLNTVDVNKRRYDDPSCIAYINGRYMLFQKNSYDDTIPLAIITSTDGAEWSKSDFSDDSSMSNESYRDTYLWEVINKDNIIFCRYNRDEYTKNLNIMLTKNNIDFDYKEIEIENNINGGVADGQGFLLFGDNNAMIKIVTKENNINGFGKSYYLYGILEYEGNWKLGEKCGNGRLYSDDVKLIYEGMFEHSMRNGKGKSYIDNKLEYNGNWKNDKKDGTGISYYQNGIKAYEGLWKNNEKSGYGKMYDENGNLCYEGSFASDMPDGEGEFYKDNKLQYKGKVSFGKKNGKGKLFSQSGTLIYEGEFSQDQINGRGKVYDDKGKFIEEKEFSNGRDSYGFDIYGYNILGYNKYGFDRKGYNVEGYNKAGYSLNGYLKQGTAKSQITSSGNSNGNIDNGGIGVRQGQWIYLSTIFSENQNQIPDFNMCKLYKVKADGSAGQKLSDQEPLNINIAGEWIYFCSESDNYSIYRIKTDGSSEKRISKVRAYCMSIAGDWIYYINAEDNKIYKMKFDGSKNTKVGGNGVARFNIVGTDIYYVKENSGIFKLMLNNASGKSAGADSNIIKEKVKDFIVQNNSIYYIDEKNNLKLYSWRPDKKGKTVKIADKITKFNIDNGYIYYVKEEHQDYTHREEVYDCENDSLWKVKCSGGKPEMLYKRDYDQIVYIYNVNIIDGLPYIEFQCENYYTNDGGQVVEGKSITSAGCIRVCM